MMLASLGRFVDEVLLLVDAISHERKAFLGEIAGYISGKLSMGEPVSLTFICTHNSRRSHLAQVWAQVAAYHYSIPDVHAFSGGTEATACNERTIASLKRAGLEVTETTGGSNPKYLLRFAEDAEPVLAYSKIFDEEDNPMEGYAAMMCCSDADRKCPYIAGAETRFSLRYTDPKESDGTDLEEETYDQRSREIASEMFYCFSKVSLSH